jgi:predicted protein tyrosine phosphatase
VSEIDPRPAGRRKLRVLFICSYNRMRSPTAEVLFRDFPGVETLSAGTSPDAEVVVSAHFVEWADVILVMEPVHRAALLDRFGAQLRGKSLVVLGIEDRYAYMDPELVRILQEKVPEHLVRESRAFSQR